MTIPIPNIEVVKRKKGLVLRVGGVIAAGVTKVSIDQKWRDDAVITLTIIAGFYNVVDESRDEEAAK